MTVVLLITLSATACMRKLCLLWLALLGVSMEACRVLQDALPGRSNRCACSGRVGNDTGCHYVNCTGGRSEAGMWGSLASS